MIYDLAFNVFTIVSVWHSAWADWS